MYLIVTAEDVKMLSTNSNDYDHIGREGKNKLTEHSELQDKICNMIIIKQFANNCPGFDVRFRPFFDKEEES